MLGFWLRLVSLSPIRHKVSCYTRKAVLRRRLSRAVRAKPVEQEFMPGHLKPTGKACSLECDDRTGRGHLEHYVAFLAAEVVMMTLARRFIARALVRQVNGDDPALRLHTAQIAVHGGEAEAPMLLTSASEHLVGRQWPRSFLERCQDGLALDRLTCHDMSLPENSHSGKLFSFNIPC